MLLAGIVIFKLDLKRRKQRNYSSGIVKAHAAHFGRKADGSVYGSGINIYKAEFFGCFS